MMLPMRLSPQLITTSPSSAGLCSTSHCQVDSITGTCLALGGPVEEVAVVGQLLLEPRLAPGGVAQPLEPGGPPVGAVHRGERVDAAPPHALLLLGRGLDDPALHGVGDVVRGDEALDVVHGEERHAEVLRVLLVPPEAGEGDRRAAVGQGADGPVLGGELGVEEEQVLGRCDPDDQALLLARRRRGCGRGSSRWRTRWSRGPARRRPRSPTRRPTWSPASARGWRPPVRDHAD